MNFKSLVKKIGFLFSFHSIQRRYKAIAQAREILELGGYRQLCADKGIPLKRREDIWAHYKSKGHPAGLPPCALFSADWYKKRYMRQKSTENPFLHYLMIGDRNGLDFCFFINNEALKKYVIRDNMNSLIYLMKVKRIFDRTSFFNEYEHLADASPAAASPCRKVLEMQVLCNGISYMNKNGLSYNHVNDIRDGDEKNTLYQEGSLIPHLPYYMMFENVSVRGSSSDIIVDDKVLVNDELYYGLKLRDVHGDPAKNFEYFNIDENGEMQVLFCLSEKEPIKNGIHLLKEYDANYFHFIVEMGIKLNFVEKHNIFPKDIPLLVSDGLSDNIYEFLDVININKRKIIKLAREKLYKVEKLYYLSDLVCISDSRGRIPSEASLVVPKGLVRDLRKTVLENLCPTKNRNHTALAVMRYGRYRRLLNIEKVRTVLRNYGFDSINPEEYRFKEQVQLFFGARAIVAPTGAALTNLLWCEKGTRVTVFYPKHRLTNNNLWHDTLGAALELHIDCLEGKAFGDIDGQGVPQLDYKINLGELERHILNHYPNRPAKQ